MVKSNAERQADFRKRLKTLAETNSAYEIDLLKKQNAQLEAALNEVRRHVGLSEIQLPKSAHKPRR